MVYPFKQLQFICELEVLAKLRVEHSTKNTAFGVVIYTIRMYKGADSFFPAKVPGLREKALEQVCLLAFQQVIIHDRVQKGLLPGHSFILAKIQCMRSIITH